MSSYRKTMGEVYNGMYLVEGNIDKIKDIVSKKSASKIDGVTVDMFTASAISQIYDKVNDANKKKMEKLPITKLAALAMKMMKNEYVPEELDLDEGTWAMPDSSKKLKGLMQVLKRPIPLGKGGDSAVSVIRDFIGDDELYDDLGDAGDKNPKGDARPIIMKAMKRLKITQKNAEVEMDERLDPADVDDDATDDDIKSADKNIMMQLRKSVSLRGNFPVEFMDKKKIRVPAKVAQAVQSKYNSLRKPNDKEKFQSQVAKSYKDMLGAIKEAVSPAQQAAIAISKKERGEKPKKESRFNTINKQLKGEK